MESQPRNVHHNFSPTVAQPSIDFHRPAKKRKVEVSIDSLTCEELEIVTKAATILKVSVPDVPAAIGRLDFSKHLAYSSGRPVSNNSRKPRRRTMRRNSMSCRNAPSTIDEPEKIAPQPANSNSTGGRCISNCLSLDLGPQQWSDCFASLAPYPAREQDPGNPSGTYMSQLSLFQRSEVDTNYLSISSPGIAQAGYNPARSVEHLNPQQTPDLLACDSSYDSAQFSHLYPALQPTASQPPIQQLMAYNIASYDMHNSPSVFAFPKEEGPSILRNGDLSGLSSSISDGYDAPSPKHQSRPSRRGAFQDPQNREQTAQTRKLKACLRCRMQKIRCDPDPNDLHGECLTCKNVTLKLSKLPCLRYKLTDIKMFHTNPAPGRSFTERWSYENTNDISTWDLNSDTEVIQITQDCIAKPLSLRVRRFVPVQGDVLDRSWYDNKNQTKKSVRLPPYALVNLRAVEKEYLDHINDGEAEFFERLLDPSDQFLWATYRMAITRANNPNTSEEERKVLKSVMRLWISVRLMTRSQHIIGQNTLGLSKDSIDESSPMHGKIPIPPVMSSQMNAIIIHKIQIPLRKKVLEKLQALIQANKPNAWFTIYLCTFMLLHNCSQLTQFEEWYARKHGRQTRYFRMDMVAEYHLGALMLLAYFHYCCKGNHPFALDWDSEKTTSMAELDTEQVQFIKQSAAYVKQNETRYNELRNSTKYEDEHFFISQLYEADWVPRMTSI